MNTNNNDRYGSAALGDRNAGFRRRDIVVPLLIALGLVVLSRISFLWFHALAELFAIVVGISLYLIASRSYVFTRNGYLLFLAQGFFWAALIDLVHTLAYAGMGLIPGNDPNSATQLWLLARALEASTLLLGVHYLESEAPPRWSFAGFGAIALGGIAAIFAGLAPAAFVVGQGLTPFKIAGEYVIIAMLAGASLRLYLRRARLDRELYSLMLGVFSLTMLSEFAFTIYVGVYDISNLVGHIFKFWAFWLLLLAITRRMLAQPFRMLSRQAHTFDHMPMPVLLTDASGIIQSCNAAARALHAGGGIGASLHDVWHPPGLGRAQCPVCRALENGETVDTELHDAATGRWAAIQLHPVAREGTVTGFVCVHSDVTEEHNAQARLIQAEKMEALGQLTSGLAHDFNNMIGAISGAHELLARQVGDNEKARRHLDLARRATERAAGVTRSLLAVARKQVLAPRAVAIESAIGEIMPLLRQTAGDGIAVEQSADPECAGVLAHIDPSGLDNALLNLVINARDAMPHGGTIRIRAQVLETDEPGSHAADLKPGRYLVVSVSDTGSGMPPEVLARAFDPFFTTKAPGKGTGLGLPMVYGYARQSGGTATLASIPGQGTTVSLFLPAISAD